MCDSIWNFGTPLPGFESATDREDDQFEIYQEFLTSLDGTVEGVEAELFDMFAIEDNAEGVFAYYPTPYMAEASPSPTLRVYWFSFFILQNEFVRMLASDLFFAIFSILFVVFWLRIHTGSSMMALSGIFMIVMSLPFTILIYKKIFNIPYYSEIHSLVLFIVLGVGADDIFVLNDSWKLTKHSYPEDITNGRNRETIHRRLLKCYRHTMSTVFNTSFTTSMAFIATGLSPLMPIATFGWFAATCIVCSSSL
jgi:predicted RND superfamily exporter protein